MKRIIDLFSPYRGLPREIYILFASRVVNAMGCFIMPLLTLILTDKIGLTPEKAGFYMSAASLLYMPAGVIGGKLTDMIGRKKMIVIFDTLGIAAYTVCGFMEPSINLMYMIMLAATFMTMAGPAHDSLVADVTTPENRDGSYSLLYMGWNLGYALGPMLGGLLYKNYLNWVFLGDALTALISTSLIIFFVKETIGKAKEDITDKSRVNERSEKGSIFSVLLKRPVLVMFTLITFWYNFAYSQWGFMLPIQANENLTNGAQFYTMMASFNGLIVIAFTPLITKLTSNIKSIRKMVIGGVLYAVGFGMLGVLNTLIYFFISVFIFTIGEIVLSISTMPFIANHTPASHRGRMSSVLMLTLGMGYSIGPAVMGKVISGTGVANGWLIIGGVVTVAAALMYRLELFEAKKAGKEESVDVQDCEEVV
ncbi:MAG: MDR family MFS transporter [Bacillota bacterium]